MRIIIVGAGGHARVVANTLLRMREHGAAVQPIGYVDDNPNMRGCVQLGLPVLGNLAALPTIDHDAIIVAIGDNKIRQRLFDSLVERGELFVTVCHPSSVIAPDVQIGDGTVVCAGAIVNPGSIIGRNVILNTACSIDHDNIIGDHAHISPAVHLGGEVSIEEGAWIGIGAIVINQVRIGAWSIVGAGACVTESVPAGLTVVGIPAKALQGK